MLYGNHIFIVSSIGGYIVDVDVKEISGTWYAGYVLDKHVKSSDFLGHNAYGYPAFDTKRTEVGESMYQLKYRDDRSQIPLLAETFIDNLRSKFSSVSFIVPVPPSKHRKYQPLIELAKAVANKMDIKIFENILIKNVETPQMKDIASNKDKVSTLLKAFSINDGIGNDGCWDALIIDDLYSSGSTLKAATMTLKTYSKVKNIYVAVFTRTKSS